MRIFLLLFVALLIQMNPVSAQGDCPLPPQLFEDRPAQVIAPDGVNVRVQAEASADLIGRLQASSVVDVYAGPVCADGLNWWLVGDDFLVGWAVEGMDDIYWMQTYHELIPAGLAGVALTYDESIVGYPVLGPEDAGQLSNAFAYPAHIRVDFPQYLFNDTPRYNSAQIHVYPANEFLNVNPDIAAEFEKFEAIMTERSPIAHYLTEGGLPEVPTENIAHNFQSQLKYIDFNGGSGFRYITLLSQNYSPPGTRQTYIFQGMTSDHMYYISARFPIQVPLLGRYQSPDGVAEGFDLMGQTIYKYDNQNGLDSYHVFQAGATFVIDGFTPDMFVPDLRDLDAMMASLIVENAS